MNQTKKVELIELFYDLIYVYAISRLSLFVEGDGTGAFVPSFFRYIIYCLVILQSWLYLTNYVNRYGKWHYHEIIIAAINMIAVLYMSNTIAAENTNIGIAFNLSMVITLLCVLILYIIVYIKNEEDISAAKNSILQLSITIFLYILAFIFSNLKSRELPVLLDLTAVMVGAFLPFFLKGNFEAKIINFSHLRERFELLTIVLFGDSIVAISEFFNIEKFTFLPTAIFIIIFLLFISYITQVHYLVNDKIVDRALRLMFTHYFIVIAINMLTISFKFILNNSDEHLFIAIHSLFAIVMFYISIYLNSKYYREGITFTKIDLIIFILSIVASVIVLIIYIEPIWGFIAGMYVLIIPNLYMIMRKLKDAHIV